MLSSMAELFPDLKRPLIVAHRGGSTGIPNTLDAFRHLIASGGEAVEFDVRRTVDGVLVVHHGPNAAGLRLARLTYDEFCRYTHQHQPTLDEAIELCGSRLHLNVEIKARGYEQAVLEWGSSQEKYCWISIKFPSEVATQLRSVSATESSL